MAVVAVLVLGAVHPVTRWGVVVVVVMGAIIGLHEAGHLIAARKTGIGADQYWIGFGPRLWSHRSPNLHWGLRLIPLGGYVRIIGMDSAPTEHHSGISYAESSWIRKVCVSGAGPAANIALATIVMVVALTTIGPPGVTTTIGSVTADSPAAGLEVGDRIVSIDGVAVQDWEQIPELLAVSEGTAAVVVDRAGQPVSVAVGRTEVEGRPTRGFALAVGNVTRAPADALGETVSFLVDGTGHLISILDTLPSQALPTATPAAERALSPVGVAQIAAQSSLWSLIVLFVVVNFFLGIFNLLPVPPFDGGHIVVAVGERVVSAVVGRAVTVPRVAILTLTYGVFALMMAVGLSAVVRDLVDPIQI